MVGIALANVHIVILSSFTIKAVQAQIWTHQRDLAMQVKPDGVQRGLVGEIVGRFEHKGFTLRGLKLFTPKKELAEEHYKDLSQKPFFKDLVNYITSGPVVAMVGYLLACIYLKSQS